MGKLLAGVAIAASIFMAGCAPDAQIASSNISKAADNFEVDRRVVFYNGITGEYMLVVEGKCSIKQKVNPSRVQITCKKGPKEFVRHQLGLSHNVTYFAEHLGTTNVSTFHHRIIWKPQSIIPDIDLRVDGEELMTDRY